MQSNTTTTIRRAVTFGAGVVLGFSFLTGPAAATPEKGNSGQTSATKDCDGTHHSDTGHGANRSGPYDNTCDGAPSGNGKGDGNASGKPCAGCVGNADDKNPPGQQPGGSDHNSGYECDGNQGVGKTNPAHTGCTEPSAADAGDPGTQPGSGSNSNGSGSNSNGSGSDGNGAVDGSGGSQPPACPAGQAGMTACEASVGSSVSTPGTGILDVVGSESAVSDASVAGNGALAAGASPVGVASAIRGRPAQVLGVQIERGDTAGLARTGYDTVPMVGIGFLLSLVGAALAGVKRREERIVISDRLAGF